MVPQLNGPVHRSRPPRLSSSSRKTGGWLTRSAKLRSSVTSGRECCESLYTAKKKQWMGPLVEQEARTK
uniref:Uncharacterized protein n=1 Tax=Human herpesvirus 2 TaxID=10310 RepID=A0A481TG69_HHV2|nr:hypothetical protein [Human alphaherpesvirus 2]QBH84753.1 hypothetical protein [Human alphaherpesvirus 2]